jgi:hypothetical protein
VIKQNIENIELGPRQLLFGFEKEKSEEQAVVMSCIKNMNEKNGQVLIDEIVPYVREAHDLANVNIIQYVFWLAEDLAIHFRMDGEILEPSKVKQVLLKSLEQRVQIVPIKSVDDSVFQDVKRFYRKLTGGKDLGDSNDQYEFARLLARKIKDWKVKLKSCQSAAKKPFVPYEKEIDDGIRFIETISAKLDSFSLINAFYENKERILKLSDDVKNISEFYTQHICFWDNLVQSFEVLNNYLYELIKDPDVSDDFQKLKQILSSPAPHTLMTDAKTLLEKITRRCGATLLTKVDNMIVKMKKHLDAYRAGPDLRNRSLYSLRTIKKRIGGAENIISMNLCLIDAEDKFDDFWDAIQR